MTLRSYLWGIKIGTLLSLTALGFVVYYIDPDKSGIIGWILFFISLFLSLSGIFILSLTWIARKVNKEKMAFSHLGMNFRQGVLLAFLAILLLLLQYFRVLTWWDGLLVAGGVFLIELYFLSL